MLSTLTYTFLGVVTMLRLDASLECVVGIPFIILTPQTTEIWRRVVTPPVTGSMSLTTTGLVTHTP